MRTIAQMVGCTLDVAQSASEGLRMLDSTYHLLLLDIGLPDADGLSLPAHIGIQYPQLPIIALTAHLMPDDRERCLRAGCSAYISKPFSFQEMLHLLQRYQSTLS
ncbi:MAG: response regulator [Anaerolinea sp.]|nr:response regulator [Anaerolinea sp.]